MIVALMQCATINRVSIDYKLWQAVNVIHMNGFGGSTPLITVFVHSSPHHPHLPIQAQLTMPQAAIHPPAPFFHYNPAFPFPFPLPRWRTGSCTAGHTPQQHPNPLTQQTSNVPNQPTPPPPFNVLQLRMPIPVVIHMGG
ncbi:hypothetical protein FRC03_003248 [Tulasnella sp. 419]|nr:hypothetical protein FRC03_003248 [Tulasnella sp. 419]